MPYMQGYEAGLTGSSRLANPYAHGSSNNTNFREQSWDRGFTDARYEIMRAALSAQGSNR